MVKVWDYLTLPHLMTQWMGEPEMKIEVFTDWKVGNAFLVRGIFHEKFENTGKVIHFEPHKLLSYSQLSSKSRLQDKEENYTFVAFQLDEQNNETILKVTAHNFPTESIYRHVDFYWKATPTLIKQMIEFQSA